MHENALILLLKKLRFETDLVLHELESTEIEGAINWGDLGCCEASYTVSSDGDSHYHVRIEEAAPGTVALSDAVRARLLARGWPDNLTVSCEW